MNDWSLKTLNEITSKIGSGATPRGGSNAYKKEGISLIRSQNILDLNFSYDGLAFIDDKQADELRNVTVQHDDILLNITGDSVARVCMVPEKVLPARVNQHVSIIRVDSKKSNSKYVLYNLIVQKEELLMQSEVGATRKALTKTMLQQFEILLPPLPEQKAIAEVLSSLDDKIDLLHRQNETLEEMAQALFRQWFVEEADESWEYIKLSDIAEVKNGFAFSSKSYVDYTPECLEVFKMGHIERGGGLRQNPKMDFVPREERLKRYILNKNDIVMAMTDMKDNVVILGVPAMIDKDNHYVLNQRVARIYLKTNDKLISQYLLYTQLNDKENIAILQSKANSGVQVNLSTQAIKDIEILIPPIRLQKEKGQTIIDLYEKKDKNMFQIKTLEKLRDNLLPKLMSGEIRVNS